MGRCWSRVMPEISMSPLQGSHSRWAYTLPGLTAFAVLCRPFRASGRIRFGDWCALFQALRSSLDVMSPRCGSSKRISPCP
jgi:hypothetical protein